MNYDVAVEVRLREGIADPQGATVERNVPTLGFNQISNVKVGKLIRMSVEASDAAEARKIVTDLCNKFLTNPVIEDAVISVNEIDLIGQR